MILAIYAMSTWGIFKLLSNQPDYTGFTSNPWDYISLL